jgi:hypothetical protein
MSSSQMSPSQMSLLKEIELFHKCEKFRPHRSHVERHQIKVLYVITVLQNEDVFMHKFHSLHGTEHASMMDLYFKFVHPFNKELITNVIIEMKKKIPHLAKVSLASLNWKKNLHVSMPSMEKIMDIPLIVAKTRLTLGQHAKLRTLIDYGKSINVDKLFVPHIGVNEKKKQLQFFQTIWKQSDVCPGCVISTNENDAHVFAVNINYNGMKRVLSSIFRLEKDIMCRMNIKEKNLPFISKTPCDSIMIFAPGLLDMKSFNNLIRCLIDVCAFIDQRERYPMKYYKVSSAEIDNVVKTSMETWRATCYFLPKQYCLDYVDVNQLRFLESKIVHREPLNLFEYLQTQMFLTYHL